MSYLLVSTVCLLLALRCRDDFFCGVWAIPMLVPAGFAFLPLLADHLPSPAILQWPLVLLTLSTNALLYYGLGAWLARRVARRAASRAP